MMYATMHKLQNRTKIIRIRYKLCSKMHREKARRKNVSDRIRSMKLQVVLIFF